MKKGGVVSNDRTLWYEVDKTIRELVLDIEERGSTINMTRTFRLYGLKFNDERSFTSRYRSEFNLVNKKTMWDVSIRELILYRDNLVGFSVKGY